MNETEKIDILIVDDKPEDLLKLEDMLKSPDLNIIKAGSGNEALGLIAKYDFALALIDVQMSDMGGFETAELMRKNEENMHIPVIFITATDKGSELVFKEYETGVFDYIFKPLNPHILKCKVNLFLELHRRNKYFKQVVEESERSKKVIEEQNRHLNELATKDGLTGLYNHRHMHEVLEREFGRARRYQSDMSCLMIDLDYFKDINDIFGHTFGDFVLKELSVCLQDHTRNSDLCFRYGGEELVALLPQTDIVGAQKVAEKFRELCESRIHNDETNSTAVTVSIGVASLQDHRPPQAMDLLTYADKALYLAKARGRNRVEVYQGESQGLSTEEEANGDENIRHFKERLTAVLEKTKTASVASLELLVRNMGGYRFQNHDRRVAQYIDLICDKLRLPPTIIDTFKRAAVLHDCFKILLGEELLTKKGVLSDKEKAQIESHPYMLVELTELFDFFANERSVLMYHHENYDGSGYPESLKGGEIPLGARIFAIADALVAMTSERSYREMLTLEKAIWELVDNAGTQFDPMLVGMFLDIIEENELLPVLDGVLPMAKEKIGKLTSKKFDY